MRLSRADLRRDAEGDTLARAKASHLMMNERSVSPYQAVFEIGTVCRHTLEYKTEIGARSAVPDN